MRALSRRETIRLMAAAGAVLGSARAARANWFADLFARKPAGTARPPCIVRPEQMEGPYFVDERLDRSDIRSDPTDGAVTPGVPLALTIRVHEIRGAACTPLAGAMVDVWQCDARGVYSDVRDRAFDTRGKKFLRGYQRTDAAGAAPFITIYPGWYPGRTVHIHFKIRTEPESRRGYEFTSQLYFDDALTDQVFSRPPYQQIGRRRTRNAEDGIFQDGGRELMLPVTPQVNGYAGAFDIGLELS